MIFVERRTHFQKRISADSFMWLTCLDLNSWHVAPALFLLLRLFGVMGMEKACTIHVFVVTHSVICEIRKMSIEWALFLLASEERRREGRYRRLRNIRPLL